MIQELTQALYFKLKQLDLFQLKSVGKPTNTLRGESKEDLLRTLLDTLSKLRSEADIQIDISIKLK
jgi:hypothetical protein